MFEGLDEILVRFFGERPGIKIAIIIGVFLLFLAFLRNPPWGKRE